MKTSMTRYQRVPILTNGKTEPEEGPSTPSTPPGAGIGVVLGFVLGNDLGIALGIRTELRAVLGAEDGAVGTELGVSLGGALTLGSALILGTEEGKDEGEYVILIPTPRSSIVILLYMKHEQEENECNDVSMMLHDDEGSIIFHLIITYQYS
jgi:hypothetical protein